MLEIHSIVDKNKWLQLRTKDLTSTEISTLFNLNPYTTLFELWHRKKNGDITEIEENDRMKWGSRLESSIANGIAQDNEWTVQPFKHYLRLSDIKLGSSFDFKITEPESAILEIKNVDSLQFKNKWISEDGEMQAPPHIELQLQHQMIVSGIETAYIGALVGGNEVHLLKRVLDPEITIEIKDRAAQFWNSISNNVEPQPDFERDANFIKQLYNNANKGTVLESDELLDLCTKYKQYKETISECESEVDKIKSQILIIMAENEKVVGSKYTISAPIVAAKEMSFTRPQYRNFRINLKG